MRATREITCLVDKWFALNAYVAKAARIEALMGHPDFRLSTPNRVYALIGGFTSMNLAGFHAADGEGYRVVADTILKLDKINPQVAARMATGFRSWRHHGRGPPEGRRRATGKDRGDPRPVPRLL